MRILIDLQGAQSASRFRGIGRYSLALALGVARNAGEHEIWLLLNSALPHAIGPIRAAFAGLVPPERIRVFDIATPAAEHHPGSAWRTRADEMMREYVIGQIAPDALLVTSLFEGFVDDAVCSVGPVGAFCSGVETAVVLYDLIPFLKPEAYLGSAPQRSYYDRKIASLRQAGLLLAISDYSRQEAIDALGLDPRSVVAISTAIDERFSVAPDGANPAALAALAALQARFGITRKLVMYAPGGFDKRKNIDGLIKAYSMLAPKLRAEHQLLIASKLEASERHLLEQHRASCGLTRDELLFTDYVDDDTLVALYRAATLFVFPSIHEGFGLPALEAMACGALVIGGDNTSLPEVIGSAEAMFDASSPAAIAEKMRDVLLDAELQERLRANGRSQAAKFSWDVTAQRALRALEGAAAAKVQATAQAKASAPQPAPAARQKRRLAYISPLPPERTGVAEYATQVLPTLMAHFDIELVMDQKEVLMPPALAHLPVRNRAWFEANAHQYDQLLYQFGNSPFHSFMFALLERFPGVVVMHDFYLSSVLSYEQMTGAMPRVWVDALYHSHGYQAVLAALGADGGEQAKIVYPCNLAVLQGAQAVIAHSTYAVQLAQRWYGAQAGRAWQVMPLPRTPPPVNLRAAARAALKLAPSTFVVCSFGFVDGSKLSHRLLQAWRASSLCNDVNCELVFVGANHGGAYGKQLLDDIAGAGVEASKRIRVSGWTDDAVYQYYLQAADVAVQLRSVSRGETSGAVLDCLNYGLPTIVNANGSMASLPDTAVHKLEDEFELDALVRALELLHQDHGARIALGQRAFNAIVTGHRPEHTASRYAEVLDGAWREAPRAMPALVRALGAVVAPDEQSLQQVAQCLSYAPQRYPQPRQLLVDVTNIVRHDLGTGIERVVRMQLLELLRRDRGAFRVEPVYVSSQGGRCHYRYAQQYACQLLGMAPVTHSDMAIDINPGDVFYAPDFAPGDTMQAAAAGIYADWRARGVSVNFLIHDLLPVLQPEFFPPGADSNHAAWLACVAANADRLICISAAVASDTVAWLAQQGRTAPAPAPAITVLHHGADIGQAPAAPLAAPPQAAAVLKQIKATPTFLMVGTVEPRKGHLQALAAFELLWRDGVQVNLVIVGSEGWKPLAPSERRTIPETVRRIEQHPELGKRLLWLKGIDDAFLQHVYLNSACLLAASEGEGFGLPLIEAARYGVPILARDIAVFREVAREHASYFSASGQEPEQLAQLAQALRDWLALYADESHVQVHGMRWKTWSDNADELLAILFQPS